MPTKAELEEIGIIEWSLISKDYKNPDLLLGNGFSLQFSQKFSYSSLFDIFLRNCGPDYQTLFTHFQTTNFELILKYLTYSRSINGLLSLPTDPIDKAINALKKGLITTIEAVHPRANTIDFDQLEKVANQLASFGNIFTTNYDLFIYHIIMRSLHVKKQNKNYVAYQDYFWGINAGQSYLQFMDYQDFKYKHVFYLHGSLFIFENNLMTVKLKRTNDSDELIDKISTQILAGNIPIFVSEGSGNDKKTTIDRNRYLRFCLEKLRNSRTPIIVFGNSLGEFDNHILDAIKHEPKDIVYCIYTKNRSIADLLVEKNSFLQNFNGYTPTIRFVDSSSVFDLN